MRLQQDSLEFRSNASTSAYPGQKEESVWTQKASAGRIIYCAWQGREAKEAFDLSHCHREQGHLQACALKSKSQAPAKLHDLNTKHAAVTEIPPCKSRIGGRAAPPGCIQWDRCS